MRERERYRMMKHFYKKILFSPEYDEEFCYFWEKSNSCKDACGKIWPELMNNDKEYRCPCYYWGKEGAIQKLEEYLENNAKA